MLCQIFMSSLTLLILHNILLPHFTAHTCPLDLADRHQTDLKLFYCFKNIIPKLIALFA